ncbi:hypothetical protein [Phenylobacterium sp.]|uniref:hypothetical protein n=1 Tax=Phenylobacterium sp. TaxID=1871053 RepID=UPI00286B8DDF|nr:hypothetical protein [Phenylobacterium sp.]
MLVATLCVALSVIFAGVSAASVGDAAQHTVHPAHQPSLTLGLGIAEADHHADRQTPDGDHDRGSAPADHPPAAGHNHADLPVGALSGGAEAGVIISRAELTLRVHSAAGAPGVRPGGLERPPKDAANLT